MRICEACEGARSTSELALSRRKEHQACSVADGADHGGGWQFVEGIFAPWLAKLMQDVMLWGLEPDSITLNTAAVSFDGL